MAFDGSVFSAAYRNTSRTIKYTGSTASEFSDQKLVLASLNSVLPPNQPNAITTASNTTGQYSAKFECYYGADHEGTGTLDIEISTQ